MNEEAVCPHLLNHPGGGGHQIGVGHLEQDAPGGQIGVAFRWRKDGEERLRIDKEGHRTGGGAIVAIGNGYGKIARRWGADRDRLSVHSIAPKPVYAIAGGCQGGAVALANAGIAADAHDRVGKDGNLQRVHIRTAIGIGDGHRVDGTIYGQVLNGLGCVAGVPQKGNAATCKKEEAVTRANFKLTINGGQGQVVDNKGGTGHPCAAIAVGDSDEISVLNGHRNALGGVHGAPEIAHVARSGIKGGRITKANALATQVWVGRRIVVNGDHGDAQTAVGVAHINGVVAYRQTVYGIRGRHSKCRATGSGAVVPGDVEGAEAIADLDLNQAIRFTGATDFGDVEIQGKCRAAEAKIQVVVVVTGAGNGKADDSIAIDGDGVVVAQVGSWVGAAVVGDGGPGAGQGRMVAVIFDFQGITHSRLQVKYAVFDTGGISGGIRGKAIKAGSGGEGRIQKDAVIE